MTFNKLPFVLFMLMICYWILFFTFAKSVEHKNVRLSRVPALACTE